MVVFLLMDQNSEPLAVFDSRDKAIDFTTKKIKRDCFQDGFKAGEVEKECRIKFKENGTIDSAYGEYFIIPFSVR